MATQTEKKGLIKDVQVFFPLNNTIVGTPEYKAAVAAIQHISENYRGYLPADKADEALVALEEAEKLAIEIGDGDSEFSFYMTAQIINEAAANYGRFDPHHLEGIDGTLQELWETEGQITARLEKQQRIQAGPSLVPLNPGLAEAIEQVVIQEQMDDLDQALYPNVVMQRPESTLGKRTAAAAPATIDFKNFEPLTTRTAEHTLGKRQLVAAASHDLPKGIEQTAYVELPTRIARHVNEKPEKVISGQINVAGRPYEQQALAMAEARVNNRAAEARESATTAAVTAENTRRTQATADASDALAAQESAIPHFTAEDRAVGTAVRNMADNGLTESIAQIKAQQPVNAGLDAMGAALASGYADRSAQPTQTTKASGGWDFSLISSANAAEAQDQQRAADVMASLSIAANQDLDRPKQLGLITAYLNTEGTTQDMLGYDSDGAETFSRATVALKAAGAKVTLTFPDRSERNISRLRDQADITETELQDIREALPEPKFVATSPANRNAAQTGKLPADKAAEVILAHAQDEKQEISGWDIIQYLGHDANVAALKQGDNAERFANLLQANPAIDEQARETMLTQLADSGIDVTAAPAKTAAAPAPKPAAQETAEQAWLKLYNDAYDPDVTVTAEQVTQAIAKHGNIITTYEREDHGMALAHVFAQTGELEAFKALQGAGIDINVEDKDGRTPLHHAAATGKESMVDYLAAQDGVTLDAQDVEGNTAMHTAAVYERLAVASKLEKAGANLDIQNNYGETPQIIYTRKAFHPQAFFDGTDLLLKDQDGKTAIDYAGEYAKHYAEMAEKHGAEATIGDSTTTYGEMAETFKNTHEAFVAKLNPTAEKEKQTPETPQTNFAAEINQIDWNDKNNGLGFYAENGNIVVGPMHFIKTRVLIERPQKSFELADIQATFDDVDPSRRQSASIDSILDKTQQAAILAAVPKANLQQLVIYGTEIDDISSLAGAPLTYLDVRGSHAENNRDQLLAIANAAPKGMNLSISDDNPLRKDEEFLQAMAGNDHLIGGIGANTLLEQLREEKAKQTQQDKTPPKTCKGAKKVVQSNTQTGEKKMASKHDDARKYFAEHGFEWGSDRVRDMQNALNAAGFNAGAADGKPGNRTLEAVKAFAAASGNSLDNFMTALEGSPNIAEAIRENAPEPLTTLERRTIEAATSRGTDRWSKNGPSLAEAAPHVANLDSLSEKMVGGGDQSARGSATRWIQQATKTMGYHNVDPDDKRKFSNDELKAHAAKLEAALGITDGRFQEAIGSDKGLAAKDYAMMTHIACDPNGLAEAKAAVLAEKPAPTIPTPQPVAQQQPAASTATAPAPDAARTATLPAKPTADCGWAKIGGGHVADGKYGRSAANARDDIALTISERTMEGIEYDWKSIAGDGKGLEPYLKDSLRDNAAEITAKTGKPVARIELKLLDGESMVNRATAREYELVAYDKDNNPIALPDDFKIEDRYGYTIMEGSTYNMERGVVETGRQFKDMIEPTKPHSERFDRLAEHLSHLCLENNGRRATLEEISDALEGNEKFGGDGVDVGGEGGDVGVDVDPEGRGPGNGRGEGDGGAAPAVGNDSEGGGRGGGAAQGDRSNVDDELKTIRFAELGIEQAADNGTSNKGGQVPRGNNQIA